MPATEAQVRANQANAKLSTGPKTPEGKEASRANALKHGLTATTVLPEREAVEIERRFVAFCEELQPSGEIGMALARHAATMSVRMERCVEHENATLTERVRQAEADFVPPEGLDEASVAILRAAAGKLALFDASKEATLARSYEARAERGFFRALKELRQHEKRVKAAQGENLDDESGSFSSGEMTVEEFERFEAEFNLPDLPKSSRLAGSVDLASLRSRVDLPFAVGKPG